MTALVARQPLQPLSMSSTQRPPRRLSARLQEKDGEPEYYSSQPSKPAQPSKNAPAAEGAPMHNGKKRKHTYDEEDDGFMFTRVKKNKQKAPESRKAASPERSTAPAAEPRTTTDAVTLQKGPTRKDEPTTNGDGAKPVKKKPPKMSFSTPKPKHEPLLRTSKRLSDENQVHASPVPKPRRKEDPPQQPPEPVHERQLLEKEKPQSPDSQDKGESEEAEIHRDHSATKIALPFADTPVIRRNKAMRENKSGKGERRSSLSLRGRRASSLIDSGNSTALPHSEVEISDFYKHIESEGLPEPRRMKQLLTWCATRCLDQKPMGQNFDDASAVAAARVIEEEVLKDLANRSDLSHWFSREDVVEPPKELPERPNPKNLQNTEKIEELQLQIKRLRDERDALEALLQPPTIAPIPEQRTASMDKALLSQAESTMLASLRSSPDTFEDVSQRLNSIQSTLGPSIDSFADGIHKMAQYRKAADNVAGTVLSVCSRKLSEKELEGRRKARHDENRSPRRDLNSVLRGLSRVDR